MFKKKCSIEEAIFILAKAKYKEGKKTMKIKPTKYYLKIINQIEIVRMKNNINWMNILRIAFKNDPEAAKRCFRKINRQDKKISSLVARLCR